MSRDLELSRRITQVFDRAFFESRKSDGDPAEGAIFVLGMPRSGTTLVEQILAAHRDVHAGDERDDILKLRKSIEGYPEAVVEKPPGFARGGAGILRSMLAQADGRRHDRQAAGELSQYRAYPLDPAQGLLRLLPAHAGRQCAVDL